MCHVIQREPPKEWIPHLDTPEGSAFVKGLRCAALYLLLRMDLLTNQTPDVGSKQSARLKRQTNLESVKTLVTLHILRYAYSASPDRCHPTVDRHSPRPSLRSCSALPSWCCCGAP